MQSSPKLVAPPLKLHAFESYALEGALHGLELFLEQHDVSLSTLHDRPQCAPFDAALAQRKREALDLPPGSGQFVAVVECLLDRRRLLIASPARSVGA
ncbi:MAG: hypothetical protein KDB40_02465 [Acidimicrobiales bacterium]|nr:hypothetical protein [Acidimicrobiales bacterium]MCB9393277.1 hypothetical protein [Acidimicrobiaceae bacterium]